jgi:error-prone DNA polymerase
MGLLRTRLDGYARSTDLERLPDGTPVRYAGLVVCRQRPGTAKGITFLLLEDEVGLVNAIVRPELYQEERNLVRSESFLVLTGRLQRRAEVINLLVRTVARLDVARLVAELVEGTSAQERAELARLAPPSHSYR